MAKAIGDVIMKQDLEEYAAGQCSGGTLHVFEARDIKS